MQSSITNNLPLAVTLGEVAGIGPEITLKSWEQRRERGLAPFFAVGSRKSLPDNAPVRIIHDPAETGTVFEEALPLLDLPFTGDITLGKASPLTAPLVIGAIDKAVELIFENKAAGLVTAPIQKSVLYDAGFDCPGHTEYLAKLSRQHGDELHPVMMLACDALKVVPLTIHMPLSQVPAALSEELIVRCGQIIDRDLRQRFGLEKPRISVAGLNPHAGEDGALGHEERDIIIPAIETLRSQGIDISGPYSADALFHEKARQNYDVVLCMYHDQALIPIKTLDFDGGVNVTLGLPLVRTSPDHGTALDIAGQGKANPASMINALKMAHDICEHGHV